MEKIKSFLSSRVASSFSIIIAIITRVIAILLNSENGGDKMFLVLQSRSFLEGKGFAVPEYFISNPQNPVFNYTPRWPPGYPFVLAPFLKIFNYDIYLATTTLDIIACVSLIIVIRKLCRQLNFPVIAVNLMTLVCGCFGYMFLNNSAPTDNLSILFFFLGISLTIKCVTTDRVPKTTIFAAAFVLFIPCLFRYSYPPLSIAATVAVLLVGLLKQERPLIKKAILLFTSVFILLTVFFLLMKFFTGSAADTHATARGYYPENLVHWAPVVPISFINLIFLTSQASRLGFSLDTTLYFLELINLIATLGLLATFLYLLFNKRFLSRLTTFKWFFIIGFFVSAATFISLGYLSFTYAQQVWGKVLWNYVYENRYYAFTYIFIQVTFIGWIFLYKESLKNILLKSIAILCGLFLFIEVSHSVYFHTKVALKKPIADYPQQDYFFTLLGELKKKYPGYEIWGGAPESNLFYVYIATYLGDKGIIDMASCKNEPINVKKKTVFAFVLMGDENIEYSALLKRSNVVFSNYVGGFNYYVIELLP